MVYAFSGVTSAPSGMMVIRLRRHIAGICLRCHTRTDGLD